LIASLVAGSGCAPRLAKRRMQFRLEKISVRRFRFRAFRHRRRALRHGLRRPRDRVGHVEIAHRREERFFSERSRLADFRKIERRASLRPLIDAAERRRVRDHRLPQSEKIVIGKRLADAVRQGAQDRPVLARLAGGRHRGAAHLDLAVGVGEQRPYVVDGALSVATVMSATGSFDHRAIDGADGAQLMQAFQQLCENPMGLVV